MVSTKPAALTVGAGRVPAVIWAESSAWIWASVMVAPSLAAEGVMV